MDTWKPPQLSFAREPYQGRAFPHCHPSHLAALGALFGVRATPPERCRMLELGCGDGWNLVPLAEELPGAEFVGVDLDAERLAPGIAAREALKLERLEFKAADLVALDERTLGRFDYIVAHGLYSWVPDAVRAVFFERVRSLLSDDGIAYVSANVYPGWHTIEVSRNLALFHAHVKQPSEGEPFLKELRQVARVFGEQMSRESPPRALAADQYRGLVGKSDYLLAYDQLGETRPEYFERIVRRAESAGLRYVTDAVMPGGQSVALSPHLRRAIAELTSDRVLREQYADFALLPAFRQLVFCRDGQLPGELAAERLRELHLAGNLRPTTTDDPTRRAPVQYDSAGLRLHVELPVVKCALFELAAAYPQALAFDELAARVRARLPNLAQPAESLCQGLVDFAAVGVLATRVRPFSLATRVGEAPRTSAVGRYQLEHLGYATNRHHLTVNLPPGFERELLLRLDGRSQSELVTELALLVESGGLSRADFPGADLRAAVQQRLEKALAEAARRALLVPEG